MKDYQIVSDRRLVLPAPVYHQCLWIIKDMDRLNNVAASELNLPEISSARHRLQVIQQSLQAIPEEYRIGVLSSIQTPGKGFDDIASVSTWRYWKQKFLYTLARNLRLY